ncbi:hypothetical protein TRAPUB_11362 [Trametes pubescens]|uniref:Uncharacterized protein n=1 Tax=Trametes pubescens TaxID=154538 RepID=A0A1M2VWV0_TRAPU|nr:hypothetical protein TRAPUB_11362 [Trametes pubescens]
MAPVTASRQWRQVFNLKVVKLHFRSDYVWSIKQFGTTNSYTTQIIVHELHNSSIPVAGINTSTVPAPITEKLAEVPATKHHHIAKDQKNVITLHEWQHEHREDAAIKGFLLHLQHHLLLHLQSENPSMAVTNPNQIVISQDHIYQHATLQVNYTTYDLQRKQDVIHIGTSKTEIMVHTLPPPPGSDSSDAMPWSYATVLRIYHCNISVCVGDRAISQCVNFVWV